MRAAVRRRYGSPTVLRVEEIETPVPSDDEILIRNCASTANRTDLHVLTGRPVFIGIEPVTFSLASSMVRIESGYTPRYIVPVPPVSFADGFV